jgi:membrane associated rhomboid family serine protease
MVAFLRPRGRRRRLECRVDRQRPTTATTIKLGAIMPALVGDGEYWRLLTGIFLHASLIHIALNGYALWIIGSVVESELGSLKYLVIFLVTGLFASACVFMFSGIFEPTVGASGAIFGLFGVFAAYNYRRRRIPFYAARLRTMAYLIVLNLVFTFTIPGISRAGHIGGLVGGLIVGLAMEGIGSKTSRTLAFWGVITAMVAATFVIVVSERRRSLRTRRTRSGRPCRVSGASRSPWGRRFASAMPYR